jgi:hypothetical protein
MPVLPPIVSVLQSHNQRSRKHTSNYDDDTKETESLATGKWEPVGEQQQPKQPKQATGGKAGAQKKEKQQPTAKENVGTLIGGKRKDNGRAAAAAEPRAKKRTV